MTRSAGLRFIIVGVLALLMFLPLGLVSTSLVNIISSTRKSPLRGRRRGPGMSPFFKDSKTRVMRKTGPAMRCEVRTEWREIMTRDRIQAVQKLP